MSARFMAAILSTALIGCAHAGLAPRDPSQACQPGAPLPTSASGAGFPCWPSGLSPTDASIHVENQRVISAPPAVVWAWLTRADLWPTWFPQARNVRFERGGPDLRRDTVVVWEMLGATIRVTVTRADAPGVIAWEGGAGGVHAYHAWLLVPEGTGTRVLTVETERGPVPSLFGWAFEGNLHRAHEEWLQGLARVTASGSPP
jgi:uncharacterized protein YndB with AHSA1/START domain